MRFAGYESGQSFSLKRAVAFGTAARLCNLSELCKFWVAAGHLVFCRLYGRASGHKSEKRH